MARTSPVRVLLSSAIAVAVVAGGIALLVLLNGHPAQVGGPTVAAPRSAVETRQDAGPVTGGRGSGAPATGAPAAGSPAAPSAPSASATAGHPPLVVLNNSRHGGLAAAAATDFRAAGWPVVLVGNFTGRIPSTTVYYDPGQEAAARDLAAHYPGVRRVLPRFPGLPGQGLTVVLTRDWTGA